MWGTSDFFFSIRHVCVCDIISSTKTGDVRMMLPVGDAPAGGDATAHPVLCLIYPLITGDFHPPSNSAKWSREPCLSAAVGAGNYQVSSFYRSQVPPPGGIWWRQIKRRGRTARSPRKAGARDRCQSHQVLLRKLTSKHSPVLKSVSSLQPEAL